MSGWELLALLLVVVTLARSQFGLLFLTVAGAIAPTLGLVELGRGEPRGVESYSAFIAGNMLIVAGYFIAPHLIRFRGRVHEASGGRRSGLLPSSSALYVTALIVGGAALYHLFASGVPLISESIETDRFDFTSSGFFGIPGRMYLYGVPIVWVMCTASAYLTGVRLLGHGPWKLATAIYLTTSVLGGFKSGLISFLLIVGLTMTVVRGEQPEVWRLVKRWWPLAIGSAVYLFWVTNLYASYDKYNGDLGAALMERLTSVSAEPKMIALASGISSANGGLIADLLYFVRKYLGMGVHGMYTTERAISARIIGVDPASDAWTTPVTVGGVPELVYVFGLVGGMVACFLVGVAIRAVYRRRTLTFGALCARAVAAIAITTWLGRGGLVYYAVNYALVSTMVVFVYFAAEAIFAPSRTSRRRRPDVVEPRRRPPLNRASARETA